MKAIEQLGRNTIDRIVGVGEAAQLLARTLFLLPSWRGVGLFIDQMFRVGVLSLLIIVVVTMDFMAQVQAYIMTHQYESLLKKANFKGAGFPAR